MNGAGGSRRTRENKVKNPGRTDPSEQIGEIIGGQLNIPQDGSQ
jgi:hypothetical protein